MTMWWLKALLLTGCVTLAVSSRTAQDPSKQWAAIIGGESPNSPEIIPARTPTTNAFADPIANTQEYNDEFATHYDYDYIEEYDENFFNNPDYIYVDTEDENYTPPKVQEKDGEVSQTADRRTLDFFYHLFNDQFRNSNSRDDDDRPVRDASTTRRPSLIEAVFTTIDNHIIEDLQEWSTYTAQHDAQIANAEALSAAPSPPKNIGVASNIKAVTPDNNIVLVTDEQGHEHVVTINDIVNSLAHLDERTLTNLLLTSPTAADDRSSNVQINSASVVPLQEPPAVAGQVPVVLGTQKRGQVGIARPARHTGPVNASEETEDEVYVVQDENGNVQLVTLEDILASLALLDDESLKSLLFEDVPLPSAVSIPPKSNAVATSGPPQTPDVKPLTIPSAVLPNNKNPSEPETPKKSTPTVTTDFDGNIQVLAHPGSVTVDLKDLSWQTDEAQEEIEPENPAPLLIGGSLVETDENGDIYITPDPDQPFTLDIQNIIALAEQARSPAHSNKITPPKSINNLEQEKEKEPEDVNRGHEILSYLAGVDDFLPAAILPSPIRSSVPRREVAQNGDVAGVNAFRTSLLQAINQQRAVPQPATPQPAEQPLIQRLVQPVVQPIVQPIVQASGGIGATLSRLLSNLVGQSSPSPPAVIVTQVEETSPEQEFIKLVVRQQAANSLDTHFGDVTIPLPQPIHFQYIAKPKQSTSDATSPQISPRADVPSFLTGLSPLIRRNLQRQANNVPRFIPPGARSAAATQRSLTTLTERSDSGPVQRTDATRKIRIIRPAVQSDTKPAIHTNNGVPFSLSNPPIAKRNTPSIRTILSKLPPRVRESLRKQVQNLDVFSSNDDTEGSLNVNKEEEKGEKQQVPTEFQAGNQLDRSSYATLPEYESGGAGGYGYGPSAGGPSNPLLDIYLLADLTKVLKVGDTNLSVKNPIVGDPAYFVRTRPQYGYHH